MKKTNNKKYEDEDFVKQPIYVQRYIQMLLGEIQHLKTMLRQQDGIEYTDSFYRKPSSMDDPQPLPRHSDLILKIEHEKLRRPRSLHLKQRQEYSDDVGIGELRCAEGKILIEPRASNTVYIHVTDI